MASPLSSCFSLGLSGSRPRDGAVTGKCVLGKSAAVWEADSGGRINDQVLPGGGWGSIPLQELARPQTAHSSELAPPRGRKFLQPGLPLVEDSFWGHRTLQHTVPPAQGAKNISAAGGSSQAMSRQLLHRKPLHAGKGEGPGDKGGTLVSSATGRTFSFQGRPELLDLGPWLREQSRQSFQA